MSESLASNRFADLTNKIASSLGSVVVFAMMGGRFPYRATDPYEIANEARSEDLYFPATWNTISSEAKDFVKRLLDVDQDRRMTAEEALRHPVSATAHRSTVI